MAVVVAVKDAHLDLDALIRTIVDDGDLHDERDVLPLVDKAIEGEQRDAVLRDLLLSKIRNVMNDQLHRSAREPIGMPLRVVAAEGERVTGKTRAYRVTLLERGVRVPGEQRRRRLGQCGIRHVRLIKEDRKTRARVALGDLQRWQKLEDVMVKEKAGKVELLGEGVVAEILGASIETLDAE